MIGVNFVISASTTTLQKGIAGAKLSFDQMRSSVAKAANGLAGFLGIGLGAGGLLKLSNDALQLAKNLQNTSEKLGLTTKFIQEMGYAADRFGVGQDTVNMALQRFVRRLGEAQKGAGELLPSLQQYNIALRDANGQARSAESVLKDYADAIKGAGTQQEKLRLAFKAFDSEGAALVSILKDGSKGFDEFAKQAAEAGAVMSSETVKGLADAEQAITDFKKRITVAVGEIVVNFKSEEGIKLLGMQFLKVLGEFGAGIIDVVKNGAVYAGIYMGAYLGKAVLEMRNGLIDALAYTATIMNKLLPSRFEFNIGNILDMKQAGGDVGVAIAKAIAQTNPTAFRDTVSEFWDDAIEKQKAVIKEQADAQKVTANAVVKPAIEAAAATVESAGVKAGEAIAEGGKEAGQHVENAAKKMTAAFGRSAEAIQDASDESLKELLRREKAALQRSQMDTSFGGDLTRANLTSTIQRIEEELAFRKDLRNQISIGGIEYARRQSAVDPLVFDRIVSEIVTGRSVSEKTVDELKETNRLLAGRFINQ